MKDSHDALPRRDQPRQPRTSPRVSRPLKNHSAINTPTDPSARPYSLDDTTPSQPTQTERPLLLRAAMERMKDTLTLAGATETSDALLADVDRNATYLQRCANEAEAVLHGDLDAATRLWLLLRQPIDAGRLIPRSILHDVAGDSRRSAPTVIDADVLLRLIAGVVRAANQPSEAEAMLDALGRLLQPLFHLDIAGAAAERARHGYAQALDTFVTAHSAPHWRDLLIRLAEPAPTRDLLKIGKPKLDWDRVPLDLGSWRDEVVKPTIDQWDSGWPCMGSTQLWASQIDRFGARYTIDSIENPEACAGQTVTIHGTNFGPPGRVSFKFPDPQDPAFELGAGDPGMLIGVMPKRWTDTEIKVVVPVWATAGELHLDAFTRHEDPCMKLDVYRLGNSILFRGGLASVYQVSLGGVEIYPTSTQPTNVNPKDAVALTWHSSGGPTTRIKIQLMDGPTVLWEQSDLPGGFGGVVLSIAADKDPQKPTSATLVFTATSDCGATRPLSIPVWLSVPPRLSIQYVEVTQGVQGDLGDVLAGRGMPTVANKDTAVRVHMNCDRGGWFDNKLDKITGALLVDGRRLSPTNVRVFIPPDRGFAAIRGLSDPNFTNDTLNFTIPAAWLTPGAHTLTVQIVCNDKSGKIVLGQNVNWTWINKAPIRVRGLYMALYGSDGFILDYVRRALDYLPTPLTDIGIAGPHWYTHTYDLSDDAAWGDLLSDLENEWDDWDEASGVRWLGIIPASERLPGVTLAWGGMAHVPGIAGLAMGDDPVSGAHEIAHTFGLHHVDLPAGASKGPYDTVDNGGFLRRPPFDVRSSEAFSLPAGDLMTYFPPQRPGITTWMRLFQNT